MKKKLFILFFAFAKIGLCQSFVFCPEIQTEEKQGMNDVNISIVFKDSRTYEKKLKEKCFKSEIFDEFASCIRRTYPNINLTVLDEYHFNEIPAKGLVTIKLNFLKYDATFNFGTYNASTIYEVQIFDNRNDQNTIKQVITGKGKQLNEFGYTSGTIAISTSFKEAFDKFILMLNGIKSRKFISKPIAIDSTQLKATGSGFFLTTDGIIATNNHVIEDANKIEILVSNDLGTFTYKAKVLLADNNNDVALIKIDDEKFKGLSAIPYGIKNNAEVGEKVYTIGYPLNTIMGNNYKVTDGIISANSGIGDDLRYFQISVALQPGNSGGPLFDSNGNIVGITTAKLNGDAVGVQIENVNYAIKISYLEILFNMLNNSSKLNINSTVTSKELQNQVKVFKNYVCLIKIY